MKEGERKRRQTNIEDREKMKEKKGARGKRRDYKMKLKLN